MNQVPDDWLPFIRSAQPVIAGSAARTLRRWSRPTPDDIDRLTEQVFVQLQGQLPAAKGHGPAWLRALASAAALDFLRSQIAQNHAVEQSARSLLLGRTARALATAGDRDRWVFWLYYRHGLTPQAIAAIAALQLAPAEIDQAIDRLAQLTDAEDYADSLRAGDPGPAEPSCLSAADVASLVDGDCATGLEELFEHLADCDRCGSLLHDALPARDRPDLGELRTSTPEWQSALAERWNRETRPGWLDRIRQAINAIEEPPPDPPAPPARRESRSRPVSPPEIEPESP